MRVFLCVCVHAACILLGLCVCACMHTPCMCVWVHSPVYYSVCVCVIWDGAHTHTHTHTHTHYTVLLAKNKQTNQPKKKTNKQKRDAPLSGKVGLRRLDHWISGLPGPDANQLKQKLVHFVCGHQRAPF